MFVYATMVQEVEGQFRTISSCTSGVQGLQVEELWSLEEESFEELKLVESPPSSPSTSSSQL